MMLSWVDGHLIAVLLLTPVIAILTVGWINILLARNTRRKANQ